MDEQPRKVILQHPIYQAGVGWLQVVVWEGSLAELLRGYGYTEVIEPADELPDETMREDEE